MEGKSTTQHSAEEHVSRKSVSCHWTVHLTYAQITWRYGEQMELEDGMDFDGWTWSTSASYADKNTKPK